MYKSNNALNENIYNLCLEIIELKNKGVDFNEILKEIKKSYGAFFINNNVNKIKTTLKIINTL